MTTRLRLTPEPSAVGRARTVTPDRRRPEYSGRRARLRSSIIGMLAPRNMASIKAAPTNSHHASDGAAATPNSASANQKLNSPK